jgi:hypothetical protein
LKLGDFVKLKSFGLFAMLLLSSNFALASRGKEPLTVMKTVSEIAQFLNANPNCQETLSREGSIKSAVLAGARITAISGTSERDASVAKYLAGMPDFEYTIYKLAVRVGTSSGDLYNSPIEVSCTSNFR